MLVVSDSRSLEGEIGRSLVIAPVSSQSWRGRYVAWQSAEGYLAPQADIGRSAV